MKKKIFTLLALCLVCMGVSADETVYTYGLQRTITSSKVSDDALVDGGATDFTIVKTWGSQDALTDKDRTAYYGSTSVTVPKGTPNHRNKANGTNVQAYNENCFFGFTITIPAGKQISLTSITGDVIKDADNNTYRMVVYNNDNVIYTCGDKTFKKSASALKTVDFTTLEDEIKKAAVQNLSGTVCAKMFFWNSGTGKYLNLKDFNIKFTISDYTQTQYTAPTISIGAYDQPTGKYPVTLSTTNEEEGSVKYCIGDYVDAEATEVTSGTIINVDPNTTISAIVTGASYDDSEVSSKTTDAMPTLATPKATLAGYSTASGLFSITLSAASGTTIKYQIDGGEEQTYSSAITAEPGAVIKAYAEQSNMTKSANLEYTVPAKPADVGVFSTPTTSGTYSDGMSYFGGAFTIPNTPNSFIGAQISSGNSSINGSIKMRIGRKIDNSMSYVGFPIIVTEGYTVSKVVLKILNNYNTSVNLSAVYADGDDSNNLLDEPVALVYASKSDVEATEVTIENLSATKSVYFVFTSGNGSDSPNQAQVLLDVTAARTYDVTPVTATGGWASMYLNYAAKVPEGATAYYAKSANKGVSVTLSPINAGQVIPAKTGVVVKGTAGTTYTFTASADDAADVTGNLFKGVTVATTCDANSKYVLSGESTAEKPVFAPFSGTTLGANKSYLDASDVVDASGKIEFIIEGEATGIDTVQSAESKAQSAIYNLNGMRVSDSYKGIVIMNGKKVINK